MRWLRCSGSLRCEGAVELAGDVAPDLAIGFPFGAAADHVGLGVEVAAHPGGGDDVDGLVQRPVSAAHEAVAGGLAAGGFDRAGSGEFGRQS
jgi:hypothetical protein